MNLIRFVLHVKRSKRSGILLKFTFQGSHFGNQALNYMPNSHTRWNTVRINNHIRNDSIHSER